MNNPTVEGLYTNVVNQGENHWGCDWLIPVQVSTYDNDYKLQACYDHTWEEIEIIRCEVKYTRQQAQQRTYICARVVGTQLFGDHRKLLKVDDNLCDLHPLDGEQE